MRTYLTHTPASVEPVGTHEGWLLGHVWASLLGESARDMGRSPRPGVGNNFATTGQLIRPSIF